MHWSFIIWKLDFWQYLAQLNCIYIIYQELVFYHHSLIVVKVGSYVLDTEKPQEQILK